MRPKHWIFCIGLILGVFFKCIQVQQNSDLLVFNLLDTLNRTTQTNSSSNTIPVSISGSPATANTDSSVSPSGLSYSSSAFQFPKGIAISPLSPSISGVVTSYSVSPALPTGLSINETTGLISGTPSDFGSASGYNSNHNYVITARNDRGNTTTTFSINITAASSKAIIGFRFVSPAVTGFVTGFNISITVPHGTSLTNLVASFDTKGEEIRIGSTTQASGTISNNFTSPVVYTVVAPDGSTAI